jgi:SAM-dependent methyltransferase
VKTVSTCPTCGSNDLRNAIRGVVAPFLARRIWGREAFQIALVCCGACGFVFFNPRLEPAEEARLYAGYRDAGYLKDRHAVEPWYTERFNAGFMDPNLLQRRKAVLADVLRGRLPSSGTVRILDFGGSHGELVRDLLPNSTAYVYDISNVKPLEGVISCDDLAECRGHEFDVIVCSNVLEHVGSPLTVIGQIRQVSAPKTLVWIEVPHESPFNWNRRLRRLAQVVVLLALRPRVGWSLLGPGMLHWMHEHVNFFSARSLQALLRAGGWGVLACETYPLRSSLGSEEMVWAMGQLAA